MALIECPECNGKVSDSAKSCPHCGYPISNGPAPTPAPQQVIVKEIEKDKPFYVNSIIYGQLEVVCPRCNSNKCKSFYKTITTPGKTKTSYKVNLNPFKPFTIANKKEKVVRKEFNYNQEMYRCDNCGYEFNKMMIPKPKTPKAYTPKNNTPNVKYESTDNISKALEYIGNHKLIFTLVNMLLIVVGFMGLVYEHYVVSLLSLFACFIISMVNANILMCAFSVILLTAALAVMLM